MKAQKFNILSSQCPSFRPLYRCSAAHNNPSTLALQIAGTKHLTDDIRANHTEIKSRWASCGSQISCYFCITASCRSFRFYISEKPKEKPSLCSTFQRLFCELLFIFSRLTLNHQPRVNAAATKESRIPLILQKPSGSWSCAMMAMRTMMMMMAKGFIFLLSSCQDKLPGRTEEADGEI